MRRVPLWLTLVPLAAGLGLYFWLWSDWAADFGAGIEGWLPNTPVIVTGFPYRLETSVVTPHLAGGDAVHLAASADRARINRGPFQPDLTIIQADGLRFSATVSPSINATIAGKTALSSVHVVAGRLARLSTVIEAATAHLGFLPVTIAADTLELHLRERGDAAPVTSPAGPVRGQLVIAGQRLRLDGGDALTLAADVLVTGPGRLTGYDAWAATGTAEITTLTLADASGDVARVKATLVPQGRGALRLAGTIDTVCPASIAAAFAGTAPPAEQRLRTPVQLAFAGTGGAVLLSGVPADLPARAVRGQVPACPALRK